MILDDVACGADPVVIAGTTADADIFGHRYLHVVDIVGVPDRFVHLVGEPQRQDVLHRLLTEIVVDTEHTVWWKHRFDDRVEFARGLQVASERLLDDYTAPLVANLIGQTRMTQLLGNLREGLRRDGQIESVVTHGAASRVELVQSALEFEERVVVIELALHEADALGKLLPDILIKRRACVLRDSVVDDLREVLVGPVTSSKSDERETRWQQPAIGEVVHGWHQLLAREVTRNSEDDERAGAGDAVQAPIGWQSKWIECGSDLHGGHGAPD